MVLSAPARKAALVAALSGLATLTVAGVGLAGADAASPPSPQPKTTAQSRALAAATAARLVGDRPAALRAGIADKFIRRGVVSSHGTQYVAYERTYKSLPVIGGDFVVSTDADGKVKGTSVAQDRMITDLATKPAVAAAKAQRTAKARLTHVDRASRPRLVVHALTAPRLAWETTVAGTRGKELSKQTVYVDARTGKVITAKERIIHGDGRARGRSPRAAGRPAARPGCRSCDPIGRRRILCRKTIVVLPFARRHVRVDHAGQRVGEVGELVVMRGEQRLRPRRAGSWPGAPRPPTRCSSRRTWPCRGRSRRGRPGCATWRRCRMCAVSCISTMNVDWPRAMLSDAPTRA